MSELTDLVENLFAKAKHLIEEHDEELTPIFFFIHPGHQVAMLECPWGNDAEKDVYVATIRHMLTQKSEISAYVQICEAYSSIDLKNGLPSEDPNHKEVVMMNLCTRDGSEMRYYLATIVKGESGKRTVKELVCQPVELEGRMGNLFAQRATRH